MKKKSVYDSVTNEKRVKLINMVSNGEKLNKSATSLNINYSTAKTILRIYRNEKRIFKKVPLKKFLIKKKVFAIEKANYSTNISGCEEKVDLEKKEESVQPNLFKTPLTTFKCVPRNLEFPVQLHELNYYLNMRMALIDELSRNQFTINYMCSMLTNAHGAF